MASWLGAKFQLSVREPVSLEDAADEFGGKRGGEATAHGKAYAETEGW
jgi:hypothetical protein